MNEDTSTVEGKPDTPNVKTPRPKKPKASVKKSATKAEKKAKGKKVKGDGSTKGPQALKKYAPEYTRDTEHKTAGGNPSVHCNDAVAKKFLGKPLDEIYSLTAKACEVTVAELKKKYGHLNLGMQRMNLGNKMRGVLNAK